MASMHCTILLTVLYFLPVEVRGKEPESISLVMGHQRGIAEEFIQIVDLPSTIDNSQVLSLEYTCNSAGIVALELLVKKSGSQPAQFFRKHWKCDSTHVNMKKKVKLRLSDDFGFSPGYFNKQFSFGVEPVLRAWILKEQIANALNDKFSHYVHANAKVSYTVQVTSPLLRPYWRPYKGCVLWHWKIIKEISALNQQICPVENEVVRLVEYPAVFNGLHYGIHRHFSPYNNLDLEKERRQSVTKPVFTVSMWLYITDFCPARRNALHLACGVFMHASWNNFYMTPLIMLNDEGYPFIEAITKSRNHLSIKVNWTLPKHQWMRLTFALEHRRWTLSVDYGDNYSLSLKTTYSFREDLLFDDAEGDFIVGGNDALVPSFVGYVGQVTFYRRKSVTPEQIPMPNPYHPMFELGLTRREVKCQKFMTYIYHQTKFYSHLLEEQVQITSCPRTFQEFLRTKKKECPLKSSFKPKKSRILNTFIKQSVQSGTPIRDKGLKNVALDIYTNATAKIEKGIHHIPSVLPLLRQSACLGNLDAMYMLSVILNNGLMVKEDEIQALAYLMLAALDKHRLSALALGHKHIHGLDGVPFDKAQAYFYYKYVAGKTRDDREIHKDTDVLTESVRLTDEVTLQQQTDEEGDVFNWLKHQAMAGVSSAQVHFARALFWGSQGLRRNMNAAMEMFRMGADQGNPELMYDYGINVYNGKTDEKNKSKGIEYVKKAAELKNPLAINALGWIAMRQRNYTLAVQHFKKAFSMGNPDSAYYLGHMLLENYHPTEPQDWDKAYKYFEFAALRGHYDAGALFAYISMKGTGRTKRNLKLAAEWARFVAEKNPAVGIVLRKGLHAYRNGDIPLSLFYYLLAADAGVEVGSFNLAWLCDENKDGIVTSMGKECTWRHFNLSVQREMHMVDSYALIKMGDFFWFGCRGIRDTDKAARFYAYAALKGDPHALFNLAFMIEEGMDLPPNTLTILNVPRGVRNNNVTLLSHLYTRCKESRRTEAYLPCSLALWKIQILDVWTKYHIWMKLSSVVGITVVAITTVTTLRHHFNTRRREDELI